VLSCDVIIWDDNTPFLFFLKTSLTPYGIVRERGELIPMQNNYLCTYDLYGPVRNAFDACRYITWGSGGGVGAKALRTGPYKSLVHRWFYEHENPILRI
jgi:hypothetical protein